MGKTHFKNGNNIGMNIAKLRVRTGLTQEKTVAKLQVFGCKLTRSAYSQIENGNYRIRISELLAMKKIFNATFDEFFEGLSIEDCDD